MKIRSNFRIDLPSDPNSNPNFNPNLNPNCNPNPNSNLNLTLTLALTLTLTLTLKLCQNNDAVQIKVRPFFFHFIIHIWTHLLKGRIYYKLHL